MLRNRAPGDIALHFAREGVAGIEQVTWGSLRDRTERVHDALVALGVVKGDIIAGVISNSVDAIVLCLATLAIGATWSSVSPDLGSQTILDRFLQIKPKLVFADDGFVYAGRLTKLEDTIAEWSRQLSSAISTLQKVVIIPSCGLAVDLFKIPRALTWIEFLAHGSVRELAFEALPFSHRAFILFSSGTVRGSSSAIIRLTSMLTRKMCRLGRLSALFIPPGYATLSKLRDGIDLTASARESRSR